MPRGPTHSMNSPPAATAWVRPVPRGDSAADVAAPWAARAPPAVARAAVLAAARAAAQAWRVARPAAVAAAAGQWPVAALVLELRVEEDD
mmetsp:Transcript_85151/g.214749  ORF Transcript_85151/g.214749 Transcript_85151/m.214749 type:complete len:90 (+) Transcript_85151:1572-1841(+)